MDTFRYVESSAFVWYLVSGFAPLVARTANLLPIVLMDTCKNDVVTAPSSSASVYFSLKDCEGASSTYSQISHLSDVTQLAYPPSKAFRL